MQIILPAAAKDNGLSALIPLLNKVTVEPSIILDFKHVAFYSPAPVVTLLSRIRYWVNTGKKVSVTNHKNCPAKTYLQRIDFFKLLGLNMHENFTRHSTNDRFVTIESITKGSEVDTKANSVAQCMSGFLTKAHEADDLKECLRYAIGEILTNVAQHSQGEGFICAQRYPQSNSIHIAISDNGIGLRKSFAGTKLEHVLPTPLLALEKALEPEVSAALLRPLTGPYDQYVNRGIGLSMVNELIRQTYGYMRVISENAIYTRTGDTSVKFEENDLLFCPGVTVELQFNADHIGNFQEIMDDVRAYVTPIGLDNYDSMFD